MTFPDKPRFMRVSGRSWGNLRAIALPNDGYDYYVDPQNRRIAKHDAGQSQPLKGWVWAEEDRILAEFDSNGDLVSRFYYATKDHVPDLMYSNKSGSWTWYRIVTDWRGSARGVYDTSTAQYVQRIDYSPFGRVLSDTNPGFQPFGFAGGLYDPDTELVRFGARDYDPLVGRWTNKDPIRFGGGDTNLYGYVMQDPVNFVDPDGLAATPPSPNPNPNPPPNDPGDPCDEPKPDYEICPLDDEQEYPQYRVKECIYDCKYNGKVTEVVDIEDDCDDRISRPVD